MILLQYKLKRCSSKECCKQCRYVMFKGTMTKWPVQKTNTRNDTKTLTTSWRNRHLDKLYFCVFLQGQCRQMRGSTIQWFFYFQAGAKIPLRNSSQFSVKSTYHILDSGRVATRYAWGAYGNNICSRTCGGGMLITCDILMYF